MIRYLPRKISDNEIEVSVEINKEIVDRYIFRFKDGFIFPNNAIDKKKKYYKGAYGAAKDVALNLSTLRRFYCPNCQKKRLDGLGNCPLCGESFEYEMIRNEGKTYYILLQKNKKHFEEKRKHKIIDIVESDLISRELESRGIPLYSKKYLIAIKE